MEYEELDERFFDIDEHGVLRIPTVLWLGLLIHIRHWLLMLLTLTSLAVGASDSLAMGKDLPGMWMAFIQVPSLLVLLTGAWRQPNAPRWVQGVWGVGHWLMGITALHNSIWVGWWLYSTPYWNRWPELYLASTALLDLAIAYWAITQPLPRKAFSEFPKPTKA
jgi:hypothetical protein